MIALDIHGLVTVGVCDSATKIGALASFVSNRPLRPDVVVGRGVLDWAGVSLPASVLRPVVHAAALGAGAFPLHAAACVADGTGVALTGWSRSGKTGTLIEFLRRGASIVAAEWSFVVDGRMLALPDAVRVRGYATPGQRRSEKVRAAVLADLAMRTARWPAVVRRVDKARAVDVDPAAWGPVADGPVTVDVIAFVVPGATGPIRSLTNDDGVARLSASLRHDLSPLRAAYDECVFRHGRHEHTVLDRLDDLIDARTKEVVERARAVLLVPTTRPPDVADVHARLSAAL